MKYKDIKDFSQRCEEHPDHQTGMITNGMIQQRLHEEIDELRDYIEQAEKQEHQFKYTPYGLRSDESGNLSIGELPRKEWVGLTDDDIQSLEHKHLMQGVEFEDQNGYWAVYRAIEAKLKEKNT